MTLHVNHGVKLAAARVHLTALKPSVAAYNAFKPNSTIRIFDEISNLLLKYKSFNEKRLQYQNTTIYLF